MLRCSDRDVHPSPAAASSAYRKIFVRSYLSSTLEIEIWEKQAIRFHQPLEGVWSCSL